MIFAKEKEELEKIEGKVIGLGILHDFQYVFKKEGKEGIEKLEKEMASFGFPLKFKEIKKFEWYDEKINFLLFLILEKIFHWKEEDFREMGRFGARVALITKIMMRYFVSLERIGKEVGKYWRKYHTLGDLKTEKIDEKERIVILSLENFEHGFSSHCRYLEGYMWQIVSYIVPKENLKVTEVECQFEGGKRHLFKITW
jgi:hypothetical protein